MIEPNPKLYREMSEPHPSVEAVNQALRAFFDEFGELRKKHKLRDVIAVVNTSYLKEDGEECDGGSWFGYGSSLNHEMMLAHTLGVVQTDRQELLASVMAKGIRRGQIKP